MSATSVEKAETGLDRIRPVFREQWALSLTDSLCGLPPSLMTLLLNLYSHGA
jgi:hypothetical protein